jgi:hypothetical protein
MSFICYGSFLGPNEYIYDKFFSSDSFASLFSWIVREIIWPHHFRGEYLFFFGFGGNYTRNFLGGTGSSPVYSLQESAGL